MLKLWLILGFFCFEFIVRNSAHDLSELDECFVLTNDECPNKNITFWYYSHMTPSGRQLGLTGSEPFDYDSPAPLEVLIHGFNSSYTGTPTLQILPELIKLPGVNILAVDFAKLVPDPCYQESVENGPAIGKCLGTLLDNLVSSHQAHPMMIHLIGFGMGAHLAAFASNYLETSRGSKVDQITGLDPAKPLYLTSNLTQRLDPSDANFVDVIHTDIFLQGMLQPIGHADFYPNMGIQQPNCGPIDILSTHECYHKRSAEYYAESIATSTPFLAFLCESLYAFVADECQPGAEDKLQPLGYKVPHDASGSYFLATKQAAPYAKGNDFTNLDRSVLGKSYLGDQFLKQISNLGDDTRKITIEIRK